MGYSSIIELACLNHIGSQNLISISAGLWATPVLVEYRLVAAVKNKTLNTCAQKKRYSHPCLCVPYHGLPPWSLHAGRSISGKRCRPMIIIAIRTFASLAFAVTGFSALIIPIPFSWLQGEPGAHDDSFRNLTILPMTDFLLCPG